MKLINSCIAISFIITAFTSCGKDDEAIPDPNVTFTASLTGAQEATPNSSTATGTATLIFNTTTKIFTVTVNHTVAAPTNGHIHKGAIGVAGPVVFPFASFTSPITFTSAALDATQEADLNANLYYVNIHSAAPYTAGEIRGQLIKQ
jgi:hypothetical protein